MPRKPKHPTGGDHRNHPKMTDADRTEIVTRLAMFDTPTEIQEDLAARGIDISRQAISKYNPDGAKYGMSKKWYEIFHTTREAWLQDQAKEPIAHRSYRLRRLSIIHNRAMKRGDLARAQSALEQAAKETGNAFSNVSKIQASGLPARGTTPNDMTPEERRNMLADRIAEQLASVTKSQRKDATKH